MNELTTLASRANGAIMPVAPWHRPGAIIHIVDADKTEAPAWYVPRSGDIYVDVRHLLGKPLVRPEDRDGPRVPLDSSDRNLIHAVNDVLGHGTTPTNKAQELISTLIGLVQHEAAHSAWSGWTKEAPTRIASAVAEIMILFDEIRVERRVVDARPAGGNTNLRTSFVNIILRGMKDDDLSTRWTVAQAWALCCGRVNAGVVDFKEVELIDVAARTLIGDDVVDELRDILDEAVELDLPYALYRYIELAEAWVEITRPSADEEGTTRCRFPSNEGEGDEADEGEGGAAADSQEDDESESESTAGGEDAKDQSKDDAGEQAEDDAGEPESDDTDESKDDAGESESKGDAGEQAEDDAGEPEESAGNDGESDSDGDKVGVNPDPVESENELDAAAAEIMLMALTETIDDFEIKPDAPLADPRVMAQKVFGNADHTIRSLKSCTSRPPTVEERQATVRLARELEQLSIPAIIKTRRDAVVPPGRLMSRAAVQQSAERAQGRMATARPWKSTARRRTEVKPMVVGIMTDTSGSMVWAQELVASTAYIFSNAARRVGARTAAVTFGETARPVVSPNTRATHVHEWDADGGWEAFDEAAAAIEGTLHLTSSRGGAKVLVVVSDGQLIKGRGSEVAKSQRWVKRFQDAGVVVVWVACMPRFKERWDVIYVDETDPRTGEIMIAEELVGEVVKQLRTKMEAR